jgi:hypothetical protein
MIFCMNSCLYQCHAMSSYAPCIQHLLLVWILQWFVLSLFYFEVGSYFFSFLSTPLLYFYLWLWTPLSVPLFYFVLSNLVATLWPSSSILIPTFYFISSGNSYMPHISFISPLNSFFYFGKVKFYFHFWQKPPKYVISYPYNFGTKIFLGKYFI